MVLLHGSIMMNFTGHERDVPEKILAEIVESKQRIQSYPKRNIIINLQHEAIFNHLKNLRQFSTMNKTKFK